MLWFLSGMYFETFKSPINIYGVKLDMQWIPVNWYTSGLEYFVAIRRLPQLNEVASKELNIYIRQKISFPFIE
jgi:hypothetical protein